METKELLDMLKNEEVQDAIAEAVISTVMRMSPDERVQFVGTLFPELAEVDWDKIKNLLPKKAGEKGSKPTWRERLDALDHKTGLKK